MVRNQARASNKAVGLLLSFIINNQVNHLIVFFEQILFTCVLFHETAVVLKLLEQQLIVFDFALIKTLLVLKIPEIGLELHLVEEIVLVEKNHPYRKCSQKIEVLKPRKMQVYLFHVQLCKGKKSPVECSVGQTFFKVMIKSILVLKIIFI